MSNLTGFRKASDTRPLPEIPSVAETPAQRRAKWSQMATSGVPSYSAESAVGPKSIYKKVECKDSTGKPNIGPLGPPLTNSQAIQLVNNSFVDPKIIAPYKNDLIKLVVEQSKLLPESERREFKTLERLSKHICSRESLPGNILRLTKQLQDLTESGEVSPADITSMRIGTLTGVARYIATGYDVVDDSHFCFDNNGNPVAVTRSNLTRKPQCVAFLNQQQETKEFVGLQSDPFKGSQQGVGRTRKHKKRSKKTLRRGKVRRNVH